MLLIQLPKVVVCVCVFNSNEIESTFREELLFNIGTNYFDYEHSFQLYELIEQAHHHVAVKDGERNRRGKWRKKKGR